MSKVIAMNLPIAELAAGIIDAGSFFIYAKSPTYYFELFVH
ncbi:hypothetical protein [Paenibacillus sp. Z6-24]